MIGRIVSAGSDGFCCVLREKYSVHDKNLKTSVIASAAKQSPYIGTLPVEVRLLRCARNDGAFSSQ